MARRSATDLTEPSPAPEERSAQGFRRMATVRLPRRETRRAGKSSDLPLAWSALALIVAAGGLAAGCGARGAAACGGRGYRLRGQVVAVAAGGGGPRLLTLRHEPVDDFVDRQGQVTGMDAMTMPFPVARGVSLAAIAPGDTVAVTLCVDWQAEPELAIVGLRRLPAGTRLDFRPARPAPGPGAGRRS
jgi:Copper binding periplasmic protein CusF